MLEELEWDSLATSEWKVLEGVKNLLQPFAVFTQLISGEDFTTLSSVYPAIVELKMHLEEFSKQNEVRVAVKVLLSELTRRFQKFTDPSDECHDPLFLMATALDPKYRLLLNPVQVESPKSTITQEIHNLTTFDELESTSSSGEGSPSHTISTIAEPPAKCFRHLDKVLQMIWKEQVKKKSKLPPGKVEVDFESTDSLADNTDPIEYWLNQQVTYPLLSSVAIDILCIPGSSAPVERVFSTADDSTIGKRNRLSDHNLEWEVLLKTNKHFL